MLQDTQSKKISEFKRDYKRLKEIGIPMPIMIEVDMEKERILKEYIKGETIYDYEVKRRTRNS